MMRVYVLVVNWNGWRDTIECLETVFRLDYPDYRVIVCDNGSSDDSCDKIIAWAKGREQAAVGSETSHLNNLGTPPVEKPIAVAVYDRPAAKTGGDPAIDPDLILIRTEENLGFAGGNNVGIEYVLARDDFSYVWLLNNDTVVEPGALQALVQRMAEKPSAGICGSTLARYDSPERIQARGGGWYCKWIGLPWHLGQLDRMSKQARTDHVERWMNYVVGASMLVSRAFLVDVGMMCEDYFLYFEELDWALRGKQKFSLAYAPDSIVYHKVGQSIGTSSDPRRKSAICDYYAIRNRLHFTRKFSPEALPTVYLSVCMALLVRLIIGQWGRAHMVWNLLTNRPCKEPASY